MVIPFLAFGISQALSQAQPGRVGPLVLPVVMDFIKVRRVKGVSDDLIQSLLELVKGLLSPPGSEASKINTGFLLASPENIEALLDLLEDSDLFTTIVTHQVRIGSLSRDSHF